MVGCAFLLACCSVAAALVAQDNANVLQPIGSHHAHGNASFARPKAAPPASPLNPDAAKKAAQITDFFLKGRGQNQSWDKLGTFVDTIGSRVSGSAGLENAVTYMLAALTADGLENVHGEAVTIPKWVCILADMASVQFAFLCCMPHFPYA